MTNLARLRPGDRARITQIGVTGPRKRRLMDMGVLVGEEVKVEKIAPLGDPIELTIKRYKLSLRKKEAEGIEVEVINERGKF
jgi:ferrous iron transport protein A